MSDRDIFVGVMIVCLINGIFSPFIIYVLGLAPLWVPGFLATEPGMIAYFSSLILSTLTLMASGVPAALYERLVGDGGSSRTSASIWLGGALFLSIPAFARLAGGL
ncbi:MAG: hypothetical protein ACK5YI_04855 [Rhodospirillales bacterium]|jgi:hypothetical protein